MEQWLVGQYRGEEPLQVAWDFQGIFTTRERAIRECRNERYFVAKIVVDESLPDDPVSFPEIEWPLLK